MNSSLFRIGNQTCAHVPANLPLEFAVKHGFTAFEWFSDRGHAGWCETDSDALTRLRLRQTAIDHDIAFSVHAPFAADPVTIAGAVAIRRSINFAADVGARFVILHLSCESAVDGFVEALVAILDDARKAGVVLTLENTPRTSPDHLNAVFNVLATMPEAVGRVGMCLDTGHANLHVETQKDYIRRSGRAGYRTPSGRSCSCSLKMAALGTGPVVPAQRSQEVRGLPAALRARVCVAFLAEALRSAAVRAAEAAPPALPPFLAGSLLTCVPRPDPLFLPPPVILLTVAHARAAASSCGTPLSR